MQTIKRFTTSRVMDLLTISPALSLDLMSIGHDCFPHYVWIYFRHLIDRRNMFFFIQFYYSLCPLLNKYDGPIHFLTGLVHHCKLMKIIFKFHEDKKVKKCAETRSFAIVHMDTSNLQLVSIDTGAQGAWREMSRK